MGMHVFLLVLKIIGIVILCLLGAVLVLCALILFVPIRYRVWANKDSDDSPIECKANVSFLLHFLSVWAFYDKELLIKAKILGIPVWNNKKKSKDNPNETDSKELVEESEEKLTESDYTVDWNEDRNSDSLEEVDEKDEKIDNEINNEIDNDSLDVKETKKSFADKIINFFENVFDYLGKVIEFILNIPDKIFDYLDIFEKKLDSINLKVANIEKKFNYYDRMYNDSRNRNAVSKIVKEVLRLLRALLPKRVKGRIHFGFEDPATMGQVLMYMGVLAPMLPKDIDYQPDFEEVTFDGNIDLKGRFSLITLLIIGFRLYFNKDVKRLYRLYKKRPQK